MLTVRSTVFANATGRVIDLEREAQMGDTADIDFEGTLDGVPFDGGKAEGYELELARTPSFPALRSRSSA